MYESEDLYEILQVHPSAIPEVVEAAYRRLALVYHPDRNDSPKATKAMKRLNLAYEVLRNPAERKAYDHRRAHGLSSKPTSPTSESQGPRPRRAQRPAGQTSRDPGPRAVRTPTHKTGILALVIGLVAVAVVLYSFLGVGEGAGRPTAIDEGAGRPMPVNEYLRVELTDMYLKKAPPTDWGLSESISDRMNFNFRYENVSGKNVDSFTGTAAFFDLSDRPIKSLELAYGVPIGSGKIAVDRDKGYEPNPLRDDDQVLVSSSLEDVKFRFEMKSIVFSDGTRVGEAQ